MMTLQEIGLPKHIHNATTPEAYREIQRTFIAQMKQARPHWPWRDPWVYVGEPKRAIVTGGFWKLLCDCGNAPSVEPSWKLACCFECGAMYEDVVIPDEWREIEATLLARPLMATRNWLPGETVDELLSETSEHGG